MTAQPLPFGARHSFLRAVPALALLGLVAAALGLVSLSGPGPELVTHAWASLALAAGLLTGIGSALERRESVQFRLAVITLISVLCGAATMGLSYVS